MVHVAEQRGRPLRRRPPRRSGHGPLLLPLVVFAAVAFMAVVYIGYVLWPRWPGPPIGPDAPALPIAVAGVTFNVPPAAIRVPVQRRPGTHERVDLAFLWPSLEPPDPNAKSSPPAPGTAPAQIVERIFVTIAGAGDTLDPTDRLLNIYPRYAAAETTPGPGGLTVLAFREGTPYRAGLSRALHPQRRGSHARHLSLRASDRCRRPGGAFPTRLARRLAHGCRQDRAADREPAAGARVKLIP